VQPARPRPYGEFDDSHEVRVGSRLHIDSLLFVFAAPGGLLSVGAEGGRQLLRLKGCPLCAVRHRLGERPEWDEEGREELGVPVGYAFRHELPPVLAALVGDQLPCVLARAGGELVLVAGPRVLARCQGSLADLRGRLRAHAAQRGWRCRSRRRPAGAAPGW